MPTVNQETIDRGYQLWKCGLDHESSAGSRVMVEREQPILQFAVCRSVALQGDIFSGGLKAAPTTEGQNAARLCGQPHPTGFE